MELNKIYNENCLDTMKRMPDGFIDLTVTSPPYDNLRTYNDNIDQTWNESVWKPIIAELYRVTKTGGVVVWVVGDATINGSETGTSFKQALYAMECGFNLHDTMIYAKGGQGATGSNNAYWQDYEYMFVFLKGNLRTFNPISDRKNSTPPREKVETQGHRHTNGETKGKRIIKRNEYGRRFNIWTYHESGTRTDHPAVFPELLVRDHIHSWSNEGDLVYDPFGGSGTTAKMAHLQKRNWILSEISEQYCTLAQKRIAPYLAQTTLF
jgi:DNA modification methylase